jgi:hypothetical protein
VLFVGAIRPYDAAEMMRRVRGAMLTVGEIVQYLRDGGLIRFYVENDKVRFEISQKNAEAAGQSRNSSPRYRRNSPYSVLRRHFGINTT